MIVKDQPKQALDIHEDPQEKSRQKPIKISEEIKETKQEISA